MNSAMMIVIRSVRDGRWLELRDAGEAQLALLWAQLALWTRPIGALAVPATQFDRAVRVPADAQRDHCERMSRAVGRAARLGVFRPRCLTRAIALSRLLTARGVVGHHIRIGVRRSGDVFVAHAWVELGSWILGDNPAHIIDYIPLANERGVATRFLA